MQPPYRRQWRALAAIGRLRLAVLALAHLAKALTRSLVLGGLAAVEHSGWLR